ncbi:MAG: DUF2817 domain-containing protein [Deltaproteobacteria bacterium]|nr:DUF2817 domain-containing protein [Deltaproteobacteria bacterium]
MNAAAAFSPDYLTARARFRSSSLALGCQLEEHSFPLQDPEGDPLTLDVAIFGSTRPRRAVVISSGTHGVEGFLGSAIQAAFLEGRLASWRPPEDAAVILLHALNPWGFAWRRRVNEDNVDLNRNFLLPGERYEGAPARYAAVDGFLNPRELRGGSLGFYPRALVEIARSGLGPIKEAVAGGQYDFPEGMFYGGGGPSHTQALLAAALPRWLGDAERVLHLDVHAGLGKRGTVKLLVDAPPDSEDARWAVEQFGARHVQLWSAKGVSYRVRGGLGPWCQATLPRARYQLLSPEFGTYPLLQVVSALRTENQTWHWAGKDSAEALAARERLKEVFAPRDPRWRADAVTQGVALASRLLERLVDRA